MTLFSKLPKPTWTRSLLVILVSVAIIVTSFVLWSNSTNPLMPEATAALQDTATVDFDNQNGWLSFMPLAKAPTAGFVFYPGGRVKAEAYAPLAQAIAEKGYYVAIVYAPLNLAFFGVENATAVIEAHPTIERWAVGGHSLGGVASALYSRNHPNTVNGLVLMASFPADGALASQDSLQVTSIYATLDGLANVDNVKNSAKDLPKNTTFVAIEGGNHGQFGYYGKQDGDKEATISHAEQTRLVADATIALLERIVP